MPAQPIRSWYPYFGPDGNFIELYGWDVVLRHIFTVLVTRPGSRQWQPEFGCNLLDMLFETNLTEKDFEDVIRGAFKWIPYVTLKNVNCKISPMSNYRGNKASINLSIGYAGETKEVSFQVPSQMDLLNGLIHEIKVTR